MCIISDKTGREFERFLARAAFCFALVCVLYSLESDYDASRFQKLYRVGWHRSSSPSFRNRSGSCSCPSELVKRAGHEFGITQVIHFYPQAIYFVAQGIYFVAQVIYFLTQVIYF